MIHFNFHQITGASAKRRDSTRVGLFILFLYLTSPALGPRFSPAITQLIANDSSPEKMEQIRGAAKKPINGKVCGDLDPKVLMNQFMEIITKYAPENTMVPEDTNPQLSTGVYRIKKNPGNNRYFIQPGVLQLTDSEFLGRPRTTSDYQFIDKYRNKTLDPISLESVVPHPSKEGRFWIETSAIDQGLSSRRNLFKRVIAKTTSIVSVGTIRPGPKVKLEFKCDEVLSFIETCKSPGCNDHGELPDFITVSLDGESLRTIAKVKTYDSAIGAWTDNGKKTALYIGEELRNDLKNSSQNNEDPLLLLKMQSNCYNIYSWIACAEKLSSLGEKIGLTQKKSKHCKKPSGSTTPENSDLIPPENIADKIIDTPCGTGGVPFYDFATKSKWNSTISEFLDSCVRPHDLQDHQSVPALPEWKNLYYRKCMLDSVQEARDWARKASKKHPPANIDPNNAQSPSPRPENSATKAK